MWRGHSSSEIERQSVGLGEKAERKFSSTGERAPGYRLSPNFFQKFKWMLAPDWAQKNALYYNFGQSVNSFFGARARQAMIETIAIVYEHTKRTQEMCLPIGHNNTEHFLCPIRSRHLLIEFLEMVP